MRTLLLTSAVIIAFSCLDALGSELTEVEVDIDVSADTIISHDPLVIKVTVSNPTDSVLHFNRGLGTENGTVVIELQHGESRRYVPIDTRFGGSSVGVGDIGVEFSPQESCVCYEWIVDIPGVRRL